MPLLGGASRDLKMELVGVGGCVKSGHPVFAVALEAPKPIVVGGRWQIPCGRLARSPFPCNALQKRYPEQAAWHPSARGGW